MIELVLFRWTRAGIDAERDNALRFPVPGVHTLLWPSARRPASLFPTAGAEMARHLASIYATEKDRVNCPFYLKIGACRHGDRCSRLHTRPAISQTILVSNMYQNPVLTQVGGVGRGTPRRPRFPNRREPLGLPTHSITPRSASLPAAYRRGRFAYAHRPPEEAGRL